MEPKKSSNSGICLSLPNDIIFHILSYLPVTTLVRFCCVCKLMQILITSDQIFIKSHLKQSLQNKAPRKIWMHNWIRGCPDEEISHHLDTPKFTNADYQDIIINPCNKFFYLGVKMFLVGCLNGLLCLFKRCGCDLDSIIYLWNPALHQCKLLPRSICKGYWTIAVGFGYDPATDDHKVGKVCSLKVVPESYVSYKVETYSLRNHCWKTKTFSTIPSAPRRIVSWRHMGLIHDGFFYWISGTNEEGCIWLNAFDMTREIFQVILTPSYVPITVDHSLRLFKGCLSISGCKTGGLTEFQLWVMKEADNQSRNKHYWAKQFVIPTPLIAPLYSTTDVTPGGKILGFYSPDRQRRLDGRLVFYDPASQRVEDVFDGVAYYDPLPAKNWYTYFVVDNFVESLVSVIPTGEKELLVPAQKRWGDDNSGKKERKTKDACSTKLFGCFGCR